MALLTHSNPIPQNLDIERVTDDSSFHSDSSLGSCHLEHFTEFAKNGRARANISSSITKISSAEYRLCCRFFYRFKPLIKRKLNFYKCSPELLEDILQEGYLALWQAIISNDFHSIPVSHIRSTVCSRMQEFWRKQITGESSLDSTRFDVPFFDQSLEELEIINCLFKAINSLSERRKTVIFQRYGLSNLLNEPRTVSSSQTRQSFNRLLKKSLTELAEHPDVTELRNS